MLHFALFRYHVLLVNQNLKILDYFHKSSTPLFDMIIVLDPDPKSFLYVLAFAAAGAGAGAVNSIFLMVLKRS